MRLATAVVAAVLLAVLPAAPALAVDGPALAVDVSADRHAINPDVYGMNGAAAALQTELGLTTDRWGGNAASRYNWTNNTHNTGSDWYYENIVRAPSDSLDSTVSGALSRGVRPVVTVPMIGWVSKSSPSSHPFACGFKVSKYGAQTGTDAQWDPDCGNGVRAAGGNVTGNDPADTSVAAGAPFVKTMVEHLVATHGSASTTGVRTYELDNEPALWDDTHRDVHPASVTYDELRDKSVATATAVKQADPGAAVAGPGDWGWCAYFFSPADSGGCGNGADRTAHGGTPIAEWYLAAMRSASESAGVRLLDVFDEHYYPQASGVALASAGSASTQALRLRSTRSLWDPTYTDESWIGSDVGAPPIRLIPWMRESVAARYPGTRTSISEYNWGALDHINGALAQADVLGIFGRERLDAAMLWAPPSSSQPGAYAFRMYRNYDGAGGRFGETSLRATSGDQDKLAIYAAQRSSDNAVTVLVVNKTAGDLTSTVALSGASTGPVAQVYRYSSANVSAIQRLADTSVGAPTTFAANSITLLVVPPGTAGPAPTALTASVSPTKVVYGLSATASGRLTSGSAGVPGRVVTLEAQRKGTTTWTSLGTATTAADGNVSKTFTPQWSGSVRWRWPGDGTYAASTSAAAAYTVLGKIKATMTPTAMRLGGTTKIAGSISPAHPGKRYAVQRYVSGAWQTSGTAYLSSAGTFSSLRKPSARGTYLYRIYWLGDTDHAPSAGSTLRLSVT